MIENQGGKKNKEELSKSKTVNSFELKDVK